MTKRVFSLIIITSLIVFIPPTFFILNFWDNSISQNIADWGTFGDYLGGTVNTLISLISLVVLTYLTHLVSEQSNQENKNISLLMKRIDAYEKLTYYLPNVNQIFTHIQKFPDLFMTRFSSNDVDINAVNEDKKELYKNVKKFTDFYYFLFTFNAQFGRLFSYDFSKSEFAELIIKANTIKLYFESISEAFRYGDVEIVEIDFEIIKNFFNDLTAILNEIRNELE